MLSRSSLKAVSQNLRKVLSSHPHSLRAAAAVVGVPFRSFATPRRKAFRVNAIEQPDSSLQQENDVKSYKVIIPKKRNIISRFVRFYARLPVYLPLFPLGALLASVALCYLVWDVWRSDERSLRTRRSPVVETALNLFAKSPFYDDFVGYDPLSGKRFVPLVVNVIGLPPHTGAPMFADDKPHQILIELLSGIRTVRLYVTAQCLASQFYDAEGNFYPYGYHEPVDPATRSSPAPQVHITQMVVKEADSGHGYVIRFASNKNDPWVRLQNTEFHKHLLGLTPQQRADLADTHRPFLTAQGVEKPRVCFSSLFRPLGHYLDALTQFQDPPHQPTTAPPAAYMRGLDKLAAPAPADALLHAYDPTDVTVDTLHLPPGTRLSELDREDFLRRRTKPSALGRLMVRGILWINKKFDVFITTDECDVINPAIRYPADVPPFSPPIGDASIPVPPACARPLLSVMDDLLGPSFSALDYAPADALEGPLRPAALHALLAQVQRARPHEARDAYVDAPPFNEVDEDVVDIVRDMAVDVLGSTRVPDATACSMSERTRGIVMRPSVAMTEAPMPPSFELEELPCGQWYPLATKASAVDLAVAPAASPQLAQLQAQSGPLMAIEARIRHRFFTAFTEAAPAEAERISSNLPYIPFLSLMKLSEKDLPEDLPKDLPKDPKDLDEVHPLRDSLEASIIAASTHANFHAMARAIGKDPGQPIVEVDGVRLLPSGDLVFGDTVVGSLLQSPDRAFTGVLPDDADDLKRITVKAKIKTPKEPFSVSRTPPEYYLTALAVLSSIFLFNTYVPWASLSNIARAHPTLGGRLKWFKYPTISNPAGLINGRLPVKLHYYGGASVQYDLLKKREGWEISRATMFSSHAKISGVSAPIEGIDFIPALDIVPRCQEAPVTVVYDPHTDDAVNEEDT